MSFRALTLVAPRILAPALRVKFQQSYASIPAQQHLRSRRDISSTAPRHASEDSEFMEAFKQSPLFSQLANEPIALKVLGEFADMMVKHGVDLSKPPSTVTLLKLAANTELRQAAGNVVQQLRRAGIKVTSENALELFSKAVIKKDKLPKDAPPRTGEGEK